jgi:thioredoxin-dependent peroxiredoxin
LLLCDTSATLISAIGMKKSPKGTTRGVIVIDKAGKVLAWEQAGPQRTVDVVMGVLPKAGQMSSTKESAPAPMAGDAGASVDGQASMSGQAGATPTTEAPKVADASEKLPQQDTTERVKTSDIAAEVADSAEKLDEHVELGPTT